MIWCQELRQKLNKGGCGLGVVEKPLVNKIQCKQFGVIRLGNNNFRVILSLKFQQWWENSKPLMGTWLLKGGKKIAIQTYAKNLVY